MKKITYDELKQMTPDEIRGQMPTNTRDGDIATAQFTWDRELQKFVLTGYDGKVH
tara:strand:- start:128 stop:292 length:165 start_codon:yes stop_codon:yes gene_type:complete